MRTKIQAHTGTYMHMHDLKQCICACMCLYVYSIQANMHLIQLLCETKYMQIQAYACRYTDVCITYTLCICNMHCVVSGAFVCAYVSYICFTYIHINQCICVLQVLQIHAHMHWQDHWCLITIKDSLQYSLAASWGHQPVLVWTTCQSDFPVLHQDVGHGLGQWLPCPCHLKSEWE